MSLTVVVAPCCGSGRTTVSYELLVHKLVLTHAEEGMLIDISLDEDCALDTPGCLSAFLLGKLHPADAMIKLPGFTTVFYTRLFTKGCKRYIKDKDWLKFLNDVEGLIGLLVMELSSNLEKGVEIVISARYNLLIEDIVKALLKNPLLRRQASVVVVGNESKKCISKMMEVVEELDIREPIIVINKVPAAEILNIRNDVLKLATFKNVMSAFIIPLSRQLYYRDLKDYVSVFKRATTNPHARVISELFKRLALTTLGKGEKGKLVALIGGLLNVTDLPNSYQLQGVGASEEAPPFVK